MINKWHDWLDMTKFDKEWHLNDLADELAEYHAEKHILKKWSELSDVVYTCTRGKWTGYDIIFPFKKSQFLLGALYMFPKYTSRWLFYRSAGRRAGADHDLHEVRNPKKTEKLHQIANRHNLNDKQFQQICERQLMYWILLP